MSRIKREPALVIGVIAAALLAGANYLAGEGLITGDIMGTIANALDPTSGWAIPIVLGFITRFFVSPAEKPGL